MKKAQVVLEYAIMFALISAALLTMAIYVRRAVQGRLYTIEEKIVGKMKGVPSPPSGIAGF